MEHKMRGGALTVRTRQIPSYASLQIAAEYQKPDPPKIRVRSVAGHDELKDAPLDSPEWAEYARLAQEVERKVEQARSDFLYDYAIESWSWDDGKNWLTDAPDGWTFPAVFARHGIKPSDNRRVDYIRYELITDNADVAILFQDALGNTAAITDAEVNAASAGFRPDDARRASAGRKAKWYQRFQRAIQRNDRGTRVATTP